MVSTNHEKRIDLSEAVAAAFDRYLRQSNLLENHNSIDRASLTPAESIGLEQAIAARRRIENLLIEPGSIDLAASAPFSEGNIDDLEDEVAEQRRLLADLLIKGELIFGDLPGVHPLERSFLEAQTRHYKAIEAQYMDSGRWLTAKEREAKQFGETYLRFWPLPESLKNAESDTETTRAEWDAIFNQIMKDTNNRIIEMVTEAMTLICPECGTKFVPKRKGQIYDKRACAARVGERRRYRERKSLH